MPSINLVDSHDALFETTNTQISLILLFQTRPESKIPYKLNLPESWQTHKPKHDSLLKSKNNELLHIHVSA